MHKIHPFLWFETQAEEAMTFYTSVFKNSKIGNVTRYPEGGPMPAGTVITAEFELEGMRFTALNGGPHHKFTDAISLFVDCRDQAEVDYYWDKLTADGGKPIQCGWLVDKYGISWQIIPEALPRLLGGSDAARSGRVMQAMMQMVKIDVARLEEAARG